MQTVYIKFLTEADRAKGFFELAKRSRIGSLPGQVYQVPFEALKILEELHIDYRRATDQATNTSSRPDEEPDQELQDWDAYVRMLLSGQMTAFAGEFVVVHQGKVIAHGSDLEKLRASAAERLVHCHS